MNRLFLTLLDCSHHCCYNTSNPGRNGGRSHQSVSTPRGSFGSLCATGKMTVDNVHKSYFFPHSFWLECRLASLFACSRESCSKIKWSCQKILLSFSVRMTKPSSSVTRWEILTRILGIWTASSRIPRE